AHTRAPARVAHTHPDKPGENTKQSTENSVNSTPNPGKISFHPSGACNIRGTRFAINMSLLRSWGCAHVAHSGPGTTAFHRPVFRGGTGAGSYINDSIQFLRRSQQRSYQPMPLGVGTPRDEQPRHPSHHARRTHRATSHPHHHARRTHRAKKPPITRNAAVPPPEGSGQARL
ncbi:MAG: hypothetical protein ACKOZV_10175, partial [Bacteroidota bacterium]